MRSEFDEISPRFVVNFIVLEMTLVSICGDTSSSVPSCVTTIAGGSDALLHILERILIIPQHKLYNYSVP